MLLYKYCDEKGVDLLKYSRIKLSKPKPPDVNDPFEFRPWMDEPAIKFVIEEGRKYFADNYKILCLSKAACNIVMWGHYCNNHKGILFQIDTDKIKRRKINFVDVIYSKDRPRVDDKAVAELLREKGTGKEFENIFIDIITRTKFAGWCYEQEVRALINNRNNRGDYLEIPPESITEVVLGMCSTWETKILVKELCGEPRFRHIKLKKAEINEKNYSLNYPELK